ncbi:hypothetical protein [Streptomyces sp. CNQ085]|uniref:phage terminase small subunit n=1 Tax=Streptomyces sp. CNQ085 TaxID=2886944 RepID=UPI001F50CBF6|nr:hypothetical protein [Streptomyces sp. CNQ085]MCI0386656.1 hypothetical protein [Streptomyces sp. CNQ085]
MPRGGARAVSGPPPDPNALRRDRPSDRAGWTTLPPDGRPGDPPDWPLTDPSGREWDLWCDLWCRPQAVMWEQMHQDLEVALLVRSLAEAERPDARADVLRLVRQYMESLGLTVQGMLRNRWRIPPVDGAGDLVVPEAEETGEPAPRRPSARDRLKVVPYDREGA